MTERNVKITSTFLGREDHGIPSFMLNTLANGHGQGFGGWDLRVYGVDALMRILDTVGVRSWEELTGAYCRVRGDRMQLTAIGHITDDKWYKIEAAKPEEKSS